MPTMIMDFFKGVAAPFQALPLLFKPRIRTYAFLPLCLTIFVLTSGAYFLSSTIDATLSSMAPNWSGWINSMISWALSALISMWASLFLLGLINILSCPFNSLLSSKVLIYLSGPSEQAYKQTPIFVEIHESFGALAAEVKKVVYYVKFASIILLLSIIPGVNVFGPLLWVIFGAWMLTIEYLDYPLSNEQIVFPESLKTMACQKATCLGFGLSITLIALIPIVNWLTVAIGVVGATVLYRNNFSTHELS